QCAHRCPVVAQSARKLGQKCVFFDCVVNAAQVVSYRGEVAGRKLRVQGAGIEQGGRGAHEVERRKYFVELDGTGFTIDFVERQAHGDAHEEDLRQLDSAPFQVQEVAVIKRL